MAHPHQERLTPKQQALRDLEEARFSLDWHAAHAVEEWNPRALLARSMEKNRLVWIGGAALAGVALMQFLRFTGGSNNRRDNLSAPAKNHGWFALLLAPLVSLGRKTVMGHAARLFESYLHQKVSPNVAPKDRV